MRYHRLVVLPVWFLIVSVAVLLSSRPESRSFARQDVPPAAQDDDRAAPAEKEAAPSMRPPIYDESADAEEQIRSALAKAKTENRRVLIQWGGNWCGWCHLLHGLMKSDPEIARKVQYEYVVVLVDVGHADKNEELLKRYDVDIEKHGLPFITVLDSDHQVVVNQETSSLEKEDKENPGHKPDSVLEFLTKYQAEPLDARTLLAEAINQAASQDKIVFLRFGAPWCGWCHRMDDWMARPEIAAINAAAFVHVKVDTDRMTHGQELLQEYCEKPGGIPWFAFIDPRTKEVLATSDGPKGNAGFPFEEFEIDHYCDMLGKCGGRITSDQIATVEKSLNESREATTAARDAAREAAKEAANGDR
jgi:thiol:disulfide interchange protein